MKIQIYILIFLSFHFGCSNSSSSEFGNSQNEIEIPQKLDSNENSNRIQNLKQLSKVEESDTYEMTKRKIRLQRNQLKSNRLSIDSLGKIFEESLLNKIIPFWEGTEWSFEGHSTKPKSGTIACGYFVSTTLQDVGLNLNRYKLAQQSPINEAQSLALNTEVKVIAGESTSANISTINRYLKEGIHFIGFDENHVGYILKKEGNLYLIHSNNMYNQEVEIEQIEKSAVFKLYNRFYIVELSTNEKLLNHWKNKKRIEIVKEKL